MVQMSSAFCSLINGGTYYKPFVVKGIYNAGGEQIKSTSRTVVSRPVSKETCDFIKQALSYFFWKWPHKSEEIKMDSPEAIANKGYETFGESRQAKQGLPRREKEMKTCGSLLSSDLLRMRTRKSYAMS